MFYIFCFHLLVKLDFHLAKLSCATYCKITFLGIHRGNFCVRLQICQGQSQSKKRENNLNFLKPKQ